MSQELIKKTEQDTIHHETDLVRSTTRDSITNANIVIPNMLRAR